MTNHTSTYLKLKSSRMGCITIIQTNMDTKTTDALKRTNIKRACFDSTNLKLTFYRRKRAGISGTQHSGRSEDRRVALTQDVTLVVARIHAVLRSHHYVLGRRRCVGHVGGSCSHSVSRRSHVGRSWRSWWSHVGHHQVRLR